MFLYIIIGCFLFAAWITWELYRAPLIEDENDTFIDKDDDPTTTCWDNDHHPDQSV